MSGPARGRRAGVSASRGVRLASVAMRIGDAPLLDRLVRGRAWIAIVAAGLLGIVFMQVSMLKLNSGISRAVASSDTLERQNSTLREQITQLASDERVQALAAERGMITPGAGALRFLDGHDADASAAAAAIKPPNPIAIVAPAAVTPVTSTPALSTATGQATAQAAVAQTAQSSQGTTTSAGAATQPSAGTGASPGATGAPGGGAASAGTQDTTTTAAAQGTTTSTGPTTAGGGAAAPDGQG